MAKKSVQFICRSCGAVHPKWMGKCPDCGAWDALEQFTAERSASKGSHHGALTEAGEGPVATPIGAVTESDTAGRRSPTGIGELDRVLGGTDQNGGGGAEGLYTAGLVPGSAVLLGGDPGIGKSTLMLQAAAGLARAGGPVLYVTSEESARQLQDLHIRLALPKAK